MSAISPPTQIEQILSSPPAVAAAPSSPVARSLSRWLPSAGLLLVIVAFVLLLALHYQPAIIHPDANGYWAQGSLILQTGHSWFKPDSNAQYIGMHWLLLGDNTFISRYPPGFPLLVGLVQEAFGWQATMLINPVLAVLTIVGIYFAVRQLTSPGFGLLAATALAVNTAFAVHALTEISHMAVAFCVVWGVYFLLKWSSTGRLGYVFAAGAIFGCIPSTRYADSIVALGVAAFLLWHVRRFKQIHWHYAAVAAGAAIPIVPLLIRNQLLLGAFWRTGYALTNEQTGFSFEWFRQHAIGYLQMLAGSGVGAMFTLGLIGMVWMLFLPRFRATAAMLLLMTVPFVVLYMSYYWAQGINGGNGGGGGNAGGMRFMVPMVPLFIIPAAWVLFEALKAAPLAARVAVPVTLLVLQTVTYGNTLLDELRGNADRKAALAIATRGLEEVAPKNAVVVASPALLQQLDFVREWKLADASVVTGRGGMGGGMGGGGRAGNRGGNFAGGQGGGQGGQPGGPPGIGGGFGGPGGGPDNQDDADRPSPQQQAKNEARAKLYTGSTQQKQQQFQNDLTAWAGKESIYVVGSAADLDRLIPGITKDEMTIVKRIPTPKPPPEEEASASRNGNNRNARNFGGQPGRPGGGRGGPFGNFVTPGEDIVIAKWDPKAIDLLSPDDFK